MSGRPDLKPPARNNDRVTPEVRELFKRTVCERDLCTMGWFSNASGTTVECRGPLQAAHVIPKSKLRNLGFGPEVIYDPRSSVPLCERHHQRHDNHIERLHSSLIPQQSREWAHELGLADLVDRYYPQTNADDLQTTMETAASS